MSAAKRILRLLITTAKYFIGMAEKEIVEIEREEKMEKVA
jgi:hypothetical protein